jgi:hypothetical protein
MSTTSSNEPEVTSSIEPKVTSSNEPEVTSSIEPKVTSSIEPKVTSSIEPKVTSSIKPEVTSSIEPKVTSSIEPEVTSSIEPEVTSSNESKVTSLNETEVTDPFELLAQGQYYELKELIVKKPEVLTQENELGYFILFAVFFKVMNHNFHSMDVDMFDWLIKTAKCDINSVSDKNDGCSLLMCASEKNSGIGIKFLVNYGADVNLRNKNGETALFYALPRKRSRQDNSSSDFSLAPLKKQRKPTPQPRSCPSVKAKIVMPIFFPIEK